jgi:EmrB/QacA subfamily drug resistance transporter
VNLRALLTDSRDGSYARIILPVACLGAFLISLDISFVILALPSIQKEFGISLEDTSWVINAWPFTFAAIVIIGGKVGDIYGRRKALMAGYFVFAVGSLLATAAINVQILQVGRVVQGLGAALIVPGSLSILAETFKGKNQGLAIGLWGSVGALGLVLGPIISGTVVALLGWRFVFALNIPLAIFAALISRDIPVGRVYSTKSWKIDYWGIGLSISFILLIVLGLMLGEAIGWLSPIAILVFGVAISTMPLFVITQLKGKDPLIDKEFFTNKTFLIGILVRFSVSFAFVSVILMSNFYMQHFLGKNPAESGLLFLPVGICVVLATPFWGYVGDRWGNKIPMVLGMGLTCFSSFLWLNLNGESDYWDILPSLVLGSIGGAAAFVTTTTVCIHALGVEKGGVSSGVMNMLQNVSAALGVAGVSAVFLVSLKNHIIRLAPGIDYVQVQAFGPDQADPNQMEAFARALSSGATFVMVMLLIGVVAALFLPSSRLTKNPRRT